MHIIGTSRAGARLAAASAVLLLLACQSPEERAQSFFERGQSLVGEGKPDKASLEFRNALQIRENFVPALFALGKLEEHNNRIDQSAQLYFRVTELDPEHLASRKRLSQILMLAGRLDEARRFADQAYALNSDDKEVLILKAALALRSSDPSAAVQFATRALRDDPGNTDALSVLAAERLSAGDSKGATELIDRAIETDERNFALQAFRIRALETTGDMGAVEDSFVRLASLYPDYSKVQIALSRWYVSQDRPSDGERVIRDFVTLNPDATDAGLYLIELIGQERGIAAAKSELQALIERGGEHVFAYQILMSKFLRMEGMADKAAELIRTIIDTTKAPVERSAGRVLLAQMMLDDHNPKGARILVDAAIAEDPGYVEGLLVRASILMVDGAVDPAIEDLRAALNQEPDSVRVLLKLAKAYERKGSVELAEDLFIKAADEDWPNSRAMLKYTQFLTRYGKFDQAERVFLKLSERSHPNREILEFFARLRLARGNWAGAEELASSLRVSGSDDWTADQILATALRGQGKFNESLEVIQSYASEADQNNQILALLVQSHLAAKQPEKAQALLSSAIKANPDNFQAYILLGSLHTMEGRYEAAESAYRSAVRVRPESDAGYLSLARFLQKRDRIEEAEETATAGLHLNPDSMQLRLLFAVILERRNKFDAAIAEYETMLKAEPDSLIVANNLASLLSDHRTDQASLDRAFDVASRLRGSNIPQFLDTLGWIYLLRGNTNEAVELMTKAAEMLPDYVPVRYHLGAAYLKLGRKDLAVQSLQKAGSLLNEEPSIYVSKITEALSQISATGQQD